MLGKLEFGTRVNSGGVDGGRDDGLGNRETFLALLKHRFSSVANSEFPCTTVTKFTSTGYN